MEIVNWENVLVQIQDENKDALCILEQDAYINSALSNALWWAYASGLDRRIMRALSEDGDKDNQSLRG